MFLDLVCCILGHVFHERILYRSLFRLWFSCWYLIQFCWLFFLVCLSSPFRRADALNTLSNDDISDSFTYTFCNLIHLLVLFIWHLIPCLLGRWLDQIGYNPWLYQIDCTLSQLLYLFLAFLTPCLYCCHSGLRLQCRIQYFWVDPFCISLNTFLMIDFLQTFIKHWRHLGLYKAFTKQIHTGLYALIVLSDCLLASWSCGTG